MNIPKQSVLPALFLLAGCGEHPCSLHIGEPAWCEELAADAPAFCQQICAVCDAQPQDDLVACQAWCRDAAGLHETTSCEEITLEQEQEQAYQDCLDHEDYPGCGGYEGYFAHEFGGD